MNYITKIADPSPKIAAVKEMLEKDTQFARIKKLLADDPVTAQSCIDGFVSYLKRMTTEGALNISRIDEKSLVQAFIDSCELKLPLDKHRSLCYLLPFSDKSGLKKIQLVVSYKGWIELAARAGISIFAKEVYEGDNFEFSYGIPRDNLYLKHVPNFKTAEKEKIQKFYAVARSPLGDFFDVMSDEQMKAHRETYCPQFRAYIQAGAKNDTNVFWVKHYEAMGKKTIIKRLINQLPLGENIYDNLRAALSNDGAIPEKLETTEEENQEKEKITEARTEEKKNDEAEQAEQKEEKKKTAGTDLFDL